MISLSVQVKLIIFSFVFGLLYKYFEIKLDKYIHHSNKLYAVINSFSLIMTFTLLYFYNIELIVNGIVHPYSLLLIILGYYLYKPIETFFKK